MKYVLTFLLALALTGPVYAHKGHTTGGLHNHEHHLRTHGKQITNHEGRIRAHGRQIARLRKQADNLTDHFESGEVPKQFVAVDADGEVVGPAFLRNDANNTAFPSFWIYLEEYDVLLKPGFELLYFTGLNCAGDAYIIAPSGNGTVSSTAFVNGEDVWAPTGEHNEYIIGISANQPNPDGCMGDLTDGGRITRQAVEGLLYEPIMPWMYRFPIAVEMR